MNLDLPLNRGLILIVNSIIQTVFVEPLLCVIPAIGYIKIHRSQSLSSVNTHCSKDILMNQESELSLLHAVKINK